MNLITQFVDCDSNEVFWQVEGVLYTPIPLPGGAIPYSDVVIIKKIGKIFNSSRYLITEMLDIVELGQIMRKVKVSVRETSNTSCVPLEYCE